MTTPNLPDPRIAPWLERATKARGFKRETAPSFSRRLRYHWWGWREGLVLYFYNTLVANLPSHKIRLFFYRRLFDIGSGSSILMGLKIYHPGRLIVGRNSVINSECVLDTRAGIYIGSNVSISPYVHIWSGGHDINSPDFVSTGGVTIIEDRVWIASGAIVVGGLGGQTLTLGEGCVVTAGSVVVRDVEPYTVVAGNPARKMAVRSRDLDYQINHFPLFR